MRPSKGQFRLYPHADKWRWDAWYKLFYVKYYHNYETREHAARGAKNFLWKHFGVINAERL